MTLKKAGALLPDVNPGLRREIYLRGKGIDLKNQLQLDLLFPCLQSDQRFIPNDCARSAIFTVRNRRMKRRAIENQQIFHLHLGVEVYFTGVELRAEDDELVWLQVLYYAKAVPLGEPVEFTIRQLCKDIGWPLNKTFYDRVRRCISRLKASEVRVINRSENSFGNGGAISLLGDYEFANGADDSDRRPTRYRVQIHKNWILLFAGNTFTNHSWVRYRKLSPVARRLADYIESHRDPWQLPLRKFRLMCGSEDKQEKSWRETVRRACAEVMEAGITTVAKVNRDTDTIGFVS